MVRVLLAVLLGTSCEGWVAGTKSGTATVDQCGELGADGGCAGRWVRSPRPPESTAAGREQLVLQVKEWFNHYEVSTSEALTCAFNTPVESGTWFTVPAGATCHRGARTLSVERGFFRGTGGAFYGATQLEAELWLTDDAGVVHLEAVLRPAR